MIKSIVTFCCSALVCALAFVATYIWIFEGKALVVEGIFVAETDHIKPAQVREYLDGYIGKPLYGVNLAHIGAQTERHPWVKRVVVRRLPPHQIVVEPVERKAVAVIDSGFVIDEDGLPFLKSTHLRETRLPSIHVKSKEKGLKKVSDAIVSCPASLRDVNEITKIVVNDDESLQVFFENGFFVELGNDKFLEKWQKLDGILKHLQAEGLHPDYIYLGNYPNPQQVAVKLRMDNDSRGINGSIETR